eukprot:8405831-Pyramimonas_sp.AAC.1
MVYSGGGSLGGSAKRILSARRTSQGSRRTSQDEKESPSKKRLPPTVADEEHPLFKCLMSLPRTVMQAIQFNMTVRAVRVRDLSVFAERFTTVLSTAFLEGV